MTKEEIAVLGHAFFDGKTLQYLKPNSVSDWVTWPYDYCPNLNHAQWRIKPDEPKTITICTFFSTYGRVRRAVVGSGEFYDLDSDGDWTHIKSLDQVVEVE